MTKRHVVIEAEFHVETDNPIEKIVADVAAFVWERIKEAKTKGEITPNASQLYVEAQGFVLEARFLDSAPVVALLASEKSKEQPK